LADSPGRIGTGKARLSELKDSGLSGAEKFVVVRSCLTRVLDNTTMDPMKECALRAGVEIIDVIEQGLCCGQPWSSKGHQQEADSKLEAFIARCFDVSNGGKVPVVIDNSPCAFAVFEDSSQLSTHTRARLANLTILDPTDFALHLARRLPLKPLQEASHFFPVCSVIKSGRAKQFEELANMLCKNPVLPLQSACCGMAGDRGLWFPELTANATDRLQWSQSEKPVQGFCTSRTCEIGLSRDELPFETIFAALEKASRPDR
jgi:D-lactate dehydrogenase